MAPTEILAQQHYDSLSGLLSKTGIKLSLLTSSVTAGDKRDVLADLESGKTDIIIGTHALLEANVLFKNLGLVIIDEQHRFGVNQRNELFLKGISPDLLIMTATPIPRTLAMTVFAGLDISVIDALPPGRQPVKTIVIGSSEEQRAINFVKNHAALGHQTFVICPLVEESDNIAATAVQELYGNWSKGAMKDLKLALLHGRMKGKEKEAVLDSFRKGETDVLISTTVIEVGIDIPNACVMLVKDAHRFGLAQLHQIRGRIGRGSLKGTCLLQYNGKDENVLKRLMVMEKYTDGFAVAEEDLKLRGPGDIFGTRQHGIPGLAVADLFRDHDILAEAAEAADACNL